MLYRLCACFARSIAGPCAAAVLGGAVVLSACSGTLPSREAVPARSLGRDVPVYVPSEGDSGRPDRPAPVAPTDSITLRDAVALALLHSPELAAFAWETRAREARTLQAGRLPNPLVGVVAEDIGASRLANGVGGNAPVAQAQTTAQLSQLVELGGKRTARRDLAARTRDLAAWDYEAARINVLTSVTHDFIDVLAAQEMIALTAQTTQLVEQVQQSVAALVAAGDASPIEETRADLALTLGRVESSQAIRTLEAARKKLAAHWGAAAATFARATGDLNVLSALPALNDLSARIAENPDLARWSVEMLQREAAVATEVASRVPDVTVTGGYRFFTNLRTTTLLLGASIPLPVFDRRGAAVSAAKSLVSKGYEERRAAEARVSAKLAEAYRALASAHDEATALRTIVLPGSQRTFEQVREGYQAGKFDFLDVLDAQRALIAAGAQHLRSLTNYHKAAADVERLIGAELNGSAGAAR